MPVALDLPGLFTSIGALLTALGGFVLVLRRLNDQKTQVSRIDSQLNGTDGVPLDDGSPTVGQRIERIERSTTEGFALVTGELESLRALFRQYSMRMDEVVHRIDDKAEALDAKLRDPGS